MHTKEPWVVECDCGAISVMHDSVAICELWRRGNPHLELEDARRIVACVNACAGIPTEKLEEHKVSLCGKSYVELEQQRDELLAALKNMVEHFMWSDESDGQYEAVRMAKAVIAKADLHNEVS